jgi:hypothetical protein
MEYVEAYEPRAGFVHPHDGYHNVGPLMSMHASVLVDSVGPPSAEVCRTATSFP